MEFLTSSCLCPLGLRHSPDSKMGGKSVAVFIALSGLLVYRSVRDKCSSANDIAKYLKRRFFRIYPLYLVTVVVLFLLNYILPEPSHLQGFFSEVLMLRIFNHRSFTNPPAWSLYVEVLFYLLLPIWVIVTRKYGPWASIVAFFLLAFTGNEAIQPTNRELALIKFFFAGIATLEISETHWFKNLKSASRNLIFIVGLGIGFLDLSKIDLFHLLFLQAFRFDKHLIHGTGR